jgi:hypothetical protein
MGTAANTLLAALPIREEPTYPPESSFSTLEAVLCGALLVVVLAAVTIAVSRRPRPRAQGLDEQSVMTAMNSLCEHGWTARLTVYGDGTELPDDAPDIEGIRVRVDWAELGEDVAGRRDVAVARRLWARSVAAALRGMVDDRRLDAQLERIEGAGRERGPG